MATHTVEEGDCICSIAAQHGVSWDAIHDLDDNDELFGDKHCNLLEPGDEVVLPEAESEPEPGSETVVTNRFGEFLVVGVDNLTLDQPFSREQPALSGLLNNKGNPKIVLTPWKVKK